MSAGFTWKPARAGGSFGAFGPSRVIEAMTELFGPPPWRLGLDNYQQFKALAIINDDFKNFLELIEEHDEILVDVEH